MHKIATLMKYFPSGTAEGDRLFLDRAFINPEQLASIVAGQPGNPRIIVGRKGVGKSAVLEWLAVTHRQHDIPALLIRPDDLDTSGFSSANDVAALKKGMYSCLLRSVADSIGSQLDGCLTGAKAKLYDGAVDRGAREADWMSKLLKLLSEVSKPISQVDGIALARSLAGGKTDNAIATAVDQYLVPAKKAFVLLLDDTDQIASPGQPDQLNRIWALLLAVRKLSQLNPFIRCVVTLRTEVWLRLTRNDRGQRDQIDHFRPLIVTLRTDEGHMLNILRRRFELASADLGNSSAGMNPFFVSSNVSLPHSQEERRWTAFILKSSRERPRDMIQLVGHLARHAVKRGADLIGDQDAESAMKDYSKERVEDLAIEMGDACPAFLDVIRAFASVDFELQFEALRGFLSRVPSRFGVIVNGRTLPPDSDASALALLGLLHEADFINARIVDSKQPRGFRHISFLDDPHLVQMSRWNELQSMVWEVHPAFRTYLLGLKESRR